MILFADAPPGLDWTHAVVGIAVSVVTGFVSVVGTALVFFYRVRHLIEASRLQKRAESRAERADATNESEKLFQKLKSIADTQSVEIARQIQRIDKLENRIRELEADYRELAEKYEALQEEHAQCPAKNRP